jgi:hypothetical protein
MQPVLRRQGPLELTSPTHLPHTHMVSGKSTLISLIQRFYDPLSGTITLDGTDIRTLNLQWLRSQLGLVSQEPVLFNLTIAENIRYACPEASAEQVEEAARNANAHVFIEQFPEGYNTRLGDLGVQVRRKLKAGPLGCIPLCGVQGRTPPSRYCVALSRHPSLTCPSSQPLGPAAERRPEAARGHRARHHPQPPRAPAGRGH